MIFPLLPLFSAVSNTALPFCLLFSSALSIRSESDDFLECPPARGNLMDSPLRHHYFCPIVSPLVDVFFTPGSEKM